MAKACHLASALISLVMFCRETFVVTYFVTCVHCCDLFHCYRYGFDVRVHNRKLMSLKSYMIICMKPLLLALIIGVGPMTVAMLMENTVECFIKSLHQSKQWTLKYLKLNRLVPVPRYVFQYCILTTQYAIFSYMFFNHMQRIKRYKYKYCLIT